MTNGQAAAIGERVAVVETEVKHMSATVEGMTEKLDMILAGQADGKKDRAEIREKLAAMEPHVKTVADIKTGIHVLKWLGATAVAIGAMIAHAKGLIALNINWLIGRL
jgi:hypothetical protein